MLCGTQEINSTEFSWLLKLIGSNSEHGMFSSEMCTDILSNLLKINKVLLVLFVMYSMQQNQLSQPIKHMFTNSDLIASFPGQPG